MAHAAALPFLTKIDLGCVLVFFLFLSVAWFNPEFGSGIFTSLERAGVKFAREKKLAILVLIFAVPLLRLSLLQFMPVPVPGVEDEFSYLLAADTFAHGRLANPPHPMRHYLEAVHVNQIPMYMSKYPPAQGAFLALGQIFGFPWLGVVLSVALMHGAILWMLYGWLPPRWAFLGAVLSFLRFGMFSYWINSYWGGSVAALGGALVTGSLPRLLRRQNPWHSLVMGLGVALLANSRPLEGLIACLPVGIVLASWLLRGNKSDRKINRVNICWPLVLVLFITAVFVCFYNWRGTGNPFLLPYQVNDRVYLNTPLFAWQKVGPPLHYEDPHLEHVYNEWARPYFLTNRFSFLRRAGKFVYFFFWPELCILIFFVPHLFRDRRTRFLLIQFSLSFVGMMLVVWFEPHYAGPILATVYGLVVQAMRHLRCLTFKKRPVGIGLTRAVVAFSIFMCLVYTFKAIQDPQSESMVASRGVWGNSGNWSRFEVINKLKKLPGKHLVIVFADAEPANSEWIYNDADIDDAKIVWARQIPGRPLEPLLEYYRLRRLWLLDANGEIYPFRLPEAPLNSP